MNVWTSFSWKIKLSHFVLFEGFFRGVGQMAVPWNDLGLHLCFLSSSCVVNFVSPLNSVPYPAEKFHPLCCRKKNYSITFFQFRYYRTWMRGEIPFFWNPVAIEVMERISGDLYIRWIFHIYSFERIFRVTWIPLSWKGFEMTYRKFIVMYENRKNLKSVVVFSLFAQITSKLFKSKFPANLSLLKLLH